MNRSFLAALLACSLIILGLATLQAPVLALALPVVTYLLVGLWQGPEGLQLKVERSLSAERVLSGGEVNVRLTVTNNGSSLEEVLLEDILPLGLEVAEGSPRRLVALPAGRSVTWTYTLRGRRGSYSLSGLRATAYDILGLVRIRRMLPTEGQLFILPPVLRLRRVAIQPRRTRVYSGLIPAQQGGPGVEFFGVREYQIGDSPRWINWRATSRHVFQTYSNEFEQERAADVGLILDGRRRTNEYNGRLIFEHSVLATAALADALLSAGNRVGMFYYGKYTNWTLPGYGKIQKERILHDLARLEPGDSWVFSGLFIPQALFPSRSQLILISPLVWEDYEVIVDLRTKGYHVLIVSPNPVSFEMAGLPETESVRMAARIVHLQRAVLLRRLRGAGIRVIDWDVDQPFEQVAKRELEYPAGWLRMITGRIPG